MHVVEPSVKLVSCTDDILKVLYSAAKRCTSESDFDDLLKEVYETEDEPIEKLILKCYKAGHESILEHASVTFHITCSRACSHQLVRH